MDWGAVAARRAHDCPVVRFEGHPAHVHEEAQVIYVVLGAATVVLEGAVVQLGESEGLWVPGGMSHAVTLEGQGVLLGPLVEIDPPDLAPQVLVHPDLHRTMMLLLSVSPTRDTEIRSLRADLERVLLSTVRPFFTLDLPEHPVARAIARRAAGCDQSLEELAADCSISARQVQRLFRSETGQSFSAWRTRARLNRAIAWVRTGRDAREAQQVAGFVTREGLERALRRETGCGLAEFMLSASPTSSHPGEKLPETA